MAFPGQIYYTVREAIFYSTGDNGVLAIFEDENGKLWWFLNGKPSITIASPKKTKSNL
jgi:hypothetical protein